MTTKRLPVAAFAVILICTPVAYSQELDSIHNAVAERWNYFLKPFHEKLIEESKTEIKNVTLSNQQYYNVQEHNGSPKTKRITKAEYLSDLESTLRHRLETFNAEKKEYEDLITGRTPIRTYHRERIDPLYHLIWLEMGQFMSNYRLVPDDEPSIAEGN